MSKLQGGAIFFDSHCIVTMVLSCTAFEIYDIRNIATLKSGSGDRGHSRSLKMVPKWPAQGFLLASYSNFVSEMYSF